MGTMVTQLPLFHSHRQNWSIVTTDTELVAPQELEEKLSCLQHEVELCRGVMESSAAMAEVRSYPRTSLSVLARPSFTLTVS